MPEKLMHKSLNYISKYFLLFADILLIFLLGAFKPRFWQMTNLIDIAATASIIGIMGIGASIVMMVGEMSFGFGAEATLIAAILGGILGKEYIPIYLVAFLIAILFACVVGVINSYFAVILGVPAFIATLALSKLWDAAVTYVNEGRTMYYQNWPDAFRILGQGYIGKIPVSVIVFIIVAIAMWFLVDKTKLGSHIQAVGNNASCCRQMGINVTKIKIFSFVLCSAICGFSGILAASKTGSVAVNLGSGMLLNAIAAAMLSATFLRPGRYNIQGTVAAAFLMAIIKNGCTFYGFPDAVQDIFNGVILLVAVSYIAVTRKEGLPSVKVGG